MPHINAERVLEEQYYSDANRVWNKVWNHEKEKSWGAPDGMDFYTDVAQYRHQDGYSIRYGVTFAATTILDPIPSDLGDNSELWTTFTWKSVSKDTAYPNISLVCKKSFGRSESAVAASPQVVTAGDVSNGSAAMFKTTDTMLNPADTYWQQNDPRENETTPAQYRPTSGASLTANPAFTVNEPKIANDVPRAAFGAELAAVPSFSVTPKSLQHTCVGLRTMNALC